MQNLLDTPSPWLSALVWVGIAALVALAIWTVVRAPGRRQDPGLPRNRPGSRRDDESGPVFGPSPEPRVE